MPIDYDEQRAVAFGRAFGSAFGPPPKPGRAAVRKRGRKPRRPATASVLPRSGAVGGQGTRRRVAEVMGRAPLPAYPAATQLGPPPIPDWEPGEEGAMRRLARAGLSTDDAMEELRLRRGTQQSIARLGARRAARETPELQSLLALSQYLQGAAGKMKGTRRKPTTAKRVAEVRSASAPAIEPLQTRLGAERAGVLRRTLARHELAARRGGLAKAIGSPETPQERLKRIETGIATGGQPGGPAKLATQRMAGPGEVTALAKHLRGVAAFQADAGPQPGAYQPSGEPGLSPQERVKLEERLKGRRLAATEKRRAGLLPPEIRRLRVMAEAQGRPMTATQARIAEVIGKGGTLTPAQEFAMSPPYAGMRRKIEGETAAQDKLLAAQREGSQMESLTTLSQSEDPKTRRWAQKRLTDVFSPQGPAAGGPELLAGPAGETPTPVETVGYQAIMADMENESPELSESFMAAVSEGDAAEAGRLMELAGIPEAKAKKILQALAKRTDVSYEFPQGVPVWEKHPQLKGLAATIMSGGIMPGLLGQYLPFPRKPVLRQPTKRR